MLILLSSVDRLVFIMETNCVYCLVRNHYMLLREILVFETLLYLPSKMTPL